MGKRKLTNVQIFEIADSYANNSDTINMSYLASLYHVSTSTISKVLHYAISNCIVNEAVANLIAEKAIRHDKLRREYFGYAKNNKVADLYEILIYTHIQNKADLLEIQNLNAKYSEIKFQFDFFDDVYSSSDEYPYTKDDLKDQMDILEKQISRVTGHIY
ncbi:MAG: hypothetical protein PHD15_04135 [Clostridia bacterium]|nr:hypothetical protein [Clostridia bacterium]MDD4386929.1 hypothetical protein [Clostridia bacterium]